MHLKASFQFISSCIKVALVTFESFVCMCEFSSSVSILYIYNLLSESFSCKNQKLYGHSVSNLLLKEYFLTVFFLVSLSLSFPYAFPHVVSYSNSLVIQGEEELFARVKSFFKVCNTRGNFCVDTMLCLAVMLPKGEVWLYSSRFLTAVSVLEEMPLQLLVVVSYLPGLSHGARIKKIRLKLITLLALKCTRIGEPLTKKWEKMVKKKRFI